MAPVPGLDKAVSLYSSDKVRERTQGSELLRDLFSNHENLDRFAETAILNKGAGWIDIFQTMYTVVLTERRAAARKTGGVAAERRLDDAVSLLRYVAERSVLKLNGQAIASLVTHMTTLLVGEYGTIDERVAVDYVKTIRTLLSFPPHLEHLDPVNWRRLMGVCWAGLLGDRVSLDDDEAWGDGPRHEEEDELPSIRAVSPSVATELVTLIPVLLSGTRMPLISAPLDVDDTSPPRPSLGYLILLKISRYLQQLQSPDMVPLEVLRSLNLVLAELELNAREEFTKASLMIFPQIANTFASRNLLALRESALVALRIMLPFVTHPNVSDADSKEEIRGALSRLVENLRREAGSRAAIRPIELETLRFDPSVAKPLATDKGAFQLAGVMAGFDFDPTQALNWAAVEFYADCCYLISESCTPPAPSVSQTPRKKRQRTEDSLTELLTLASISQPQTRQLACQVIVFLLAKHSATLQSHATVAIRRKLLELIQSEDAEKDSVVQSWCFIGLSFMATFDDTPTDPLYRSQPANPSFPTRPREESPWEALWSLAMRCTSERSVSRAACHAANVVLNTGKVDRTRCVNDIHTFLLEIKFRSPDISDSSTAFLAACLRTIHADPGLYSEGLADEVIRLFGRKFNNVYDSKSLSSATPSNILDFLSSICRLSSCGIADVSVAEHLPDSPIVYQTIQAAKTAPIRNNILYGTVPSLTETSTSVPRIAAESESRSEATLESLEVLDGRPLKLSRILCLALESVREEWVSNTRPAFVTARRLRTAIDLVVLVLAFQATVQANGLRPDSHGCLQSAVSLLGLILPNLRTFSDNVPQQHLVWRGFMPLYYRKSPEPDTWPILLRPDHDSGIRRDVLPPSRYASHQDEGEEPGNNPRDKLLAVIWRRQEVQDALTEIVETTTAVLQNVCSPKATNGVDDADDEFGAILTTDGMDAMTQSAEAKEAQRSSESLIQTLVDIRVRLPLLSSPDFQPTKDIPLLNIFLSAERGRFLQIGFAICDAIMEKSLRLTVHALDIILELLAERLRKYVFNRDGDFLRLALVFLTCSVNFWVSSESGLTGPAIDIVQTLVYMGEVGRLFAWPARLQLLVLIDEYLQYDPTYTTWIQEQGDVSMDGSEVAWGPLSYVLAATKDIDSRVRFRAVTSAAGVHYLELPAEHQRRAYFDVLSGQSRMVYNWDHYLTNVIWKLNTCLASSQLRSATMFHLYEVIDFDASFLDHLRPGLEAVAHRLGLSSLKPLFVAHATILITNQLRCGQLPLSLPCALYGCSTRREFARLCIETVGPTLLAHPTTDNYLSFFSDACQAALFPEHLARERYLPFAAAIAVVESLRELDYPTTEAITRTSLAALAALPPASDKVDNARLIKSRIELIVSSLIGLTDLSLSNQSLGGILNSMDKGIAGDIFLQLMEHDNEKNEAPTVLDPCGPDSVILQAHGFFRIQFKNMSKRRMVFDSIVRLFHAFNDTYLVNEQRRYLRAIAMLVSLYSAEFAYGTILQQFLRNVVELLTMENFAHVAMSMLEWGFGQVPKCERDEPDLVDILINLGSVHGKLQGNEALESVAQRLDEWIASRAQSWMRSSIIETALETALVFWPSKWAANFQLAADFDYDTVATIAERRTIQNPMALCPRLDKAVDAKDTAQKEAFLSSTFWYLKKGIVTSQWDSDNALCFIDFVSKAGGDVHAPSLRTIKGLMGRSRMNEHGKYYSKYPDLGLRVLVMGALVERTATEDYRLRTTAFDVLQSMVSILKEMVDKTPAAIPNQLRDLIVYLIPQTSVWPSQQVDIKDLIAEASGSSWVYKARAHGTWAKELALMLGTLAAHDDPFYACLRPMLSLEGNAAIELLPYLVQAVLTCGSTAHIDETERRAAALATHFTQVLKFPGAATQTLEAIINIVLHLRHFQPPYGYGELSYNHWLDIDPIVLSEAAEKCGAYTSSLLFLELAKDRDDAQGDADFDLSTPQIQKIMYDIYSNVEDPDGFYGIQNNDVWDSLLRRLDHENQPLKSLGYNLSSYEATRSAPAMVSAAGNMHNLGFHSVSATLLKTMRREGDRDATSDPLFLEQAWRMGDWDVPVSPALAETAPGRLYSALRAVHRERDRDHVRQLVDETIRKEMVRLKDIGAERMTEIKAAAINLQCLRDIAKWTSPSMQTAIDQSDFGGAILSSFVHLSPSDDFDRAERLSATRLSLIRSARAREAKLLLGDLVSSQSEGLANLEIACQLRLSQLARQEGNLQAASNAVIAVRHLQTELQPSDDAQDEFSQVLWAENHHSLAIQHITGITSRLDRKKDGRRLALLLGRAAHWNAIAKLKPAEEIRQVFRESMELGRLHKASDREQAQVAYEFASWADGYHTTLSKSPELERLKSFVSRKSQALQQPDGSVRSTPTRQEQAELQELEEERSSMRKMKKEQFHYLESALNGYAGALALCDDYDDCVTRLCSLWLEHDKDEDANKVFAPRLEMISPHKFIILAPQLAARLFRPTQPTSFNSNLNSLMLRLAQQHPYHVLYQIITLASGVKRLSASSRSKASKSQSASSDGRGAAAAEIMERLRSDKTYSLATKASQGMEVFAKASVDWAQYCHDHKDEVVPGKDIQVPPSFPLNAIRRSDIGIPVATVVPPVDLTLKYSNVPTVDRYLSQYRAAGGVHRPAIMTVIDTLGKDHVQLFKAEDEVRQDAVMEQVFDMTNRLLRRDRKTHIRNLHFRTYTVVPLANKTGIIEFVGNTTAIGDWLKPAHVRYRKSVDTPPEGMRKLLSSIQEKDYMSDRMVTAYQNAMLKFQPVMRHFFTEKCREPLAWFSMRLSYARSVAVTSIVGYMVGLGDRHCSNILIDKITGELVQIDFGIVFEEGRKLRIPEKVPFRLTNDIVDGLGITGVNGTFRQCSEHTLRVLRDSSDLILTVLEVFKHDPLYAWTGNVGKMIRAQGGGRVDPTEAQQDKAERVLMRIRQKLNRELSIEVLVNMLIQEARDPNNLARIYVGWQSWL